MPGGPAHILAHSAKGIDSVQSGPFKVKNHCSKSFHKSELKCWFTRLTLNGPSKSPVRDLEDWTKPTH